MDPALAAFDTWQAARPGAAGRAPLPVYPVSPGVDTAAVAFATTDSAHATPPSPPPPLCATHRWASGRHVGLAGLSRLLLSAAPGRGSSPESDGGSGPVALLLVGNSGSTLYSAGSAGSHPMPRLRQPPGTKPPLPHRPTSPPPPPAADSNNPAAAARALRRAVDAAMLTRFQPQDPPSLPPHLVSAAGSLHIPPGDAGAVAAVEIDGGLRLCNARAKNDPLAERSSRRSALPHHPTAPLPLDRLSEVHAVVYIAPLETTRAVEAALRRRDPRRPPDWLPDPRTLAAAMAPALMRIGERMNTRCRTVAPEAPAARFTRKVQLWAACAGHGIKRVPVGAARYVPPDPWLRGDSAEAATPAPAQRRLSDSFTASHRHPPPPPIEPRPPLGDNVPSFKAARSLVLPPNQAEDKTDACIFRAMQRGLLSGVLRLAQPGTPAAAAPFRHCCALCTDERRVLEGGLLPTRGWEALVMTRPPRPPAARTAEAAKGGARAKARNAVLRACGELGLPLAHLAKLHKAVDVAHPAMLGDVGGVLYGAGVAPSDANGFSDRRRCRRYELAGHRALFASLALRLAVRALAAADYDQDAACLGGGGGSSVAAALRALGLADEPAADAADLAVALGVLRATLVFEVGAAVGLVDPTLLDAGACATGDAPLAAALASSSADFAARHVRVFFDGDEAPLLSTRCTARTPLTISAAAVGPGVAAAVADFLQHDLGPAALQAALPQLAKLVAAVTAGDWDAYALRAVHCLLQQQPPRTTPKKPAAAFKARRQSRLKLRRPPAPDATTPGAPPHSIPALRHMSGLRDVAAGAAGSLPAAVAAALASGWAAALKDKPPPRPPAASPGRLAQTGIRSWALAADTCGGSPFAGSAVLGLVGCDRARGLFAGGRQKADECAQQAARGGDDTEADRERPPIPGHRAAQKNPPDNTVPIWVALMVLSNGTFPKAWAKNLERVIADRSGESRVDGDIGGRAHEYIDLDPESDADPAPRGAPCKKRKLSLPPPRGDETETEGSEAAQDPRPSPSPSHVSQTPSPRILTQAV